MTKTVVHISTVHPTYDQRIYHRECYSVANAGFKTYLIVHAKQNPLMSDGVQVVSIGNPPKVGLKARFFSRLTAIWRARQITRLIPADIYHLHDPELIPLGLWLKRFKKSKVVFDAHENYAGFMLQRYYLHPSLRYLLSRLMIVLEKSAARSFDAIVTADQGVLEIYRSYGASNICVLHNFPRLEFFPMTEGIGGNEHKEYDLVYHGSIPRYHLEVAFAVAEELRSRGLAKRWLFFGRCAEKKWAESEIKRRGLQEFFSIEGEIPHKQVATKVLSAKIGFIPLPNLPKFQQNIPTKLFEFMALGMPVVLSDLPPSRPFVGDGKCAIMVYPSDYSAYADAIVNLLDNPTLCIQMGLEGRQRVEQRYNWEKESNKLIELYKGLLHT